MFNDLNRFEKGYLIIGITINLILAYITKSALLALINGILSLFVGVYNAKGKVMVFYFAIVETLCYITISYQQHYFSEVFINLFFHIPLTMVSIYKWTHNQNEKTKTISVTTQSRKQLLTVVLSQVVMSIGYYYFFKMMGNEMLLVSTINMVLTFLALYFNAMMSEYTFICYIASASFKVLLWGAPLLKGDFSAVPILISCFMYLVMDFYGLNNWRKLKKQQAETPAA